MKSHLTAPKDTYRGFPGGAGGKEPTFQFRRHKRHGFHPWVGKIPWRRAWQPTLVSLPGESHEQRSLAGSVGSQRVGRDRVTITFTFSLFIPSLYEY